MPKLQDISKKCYIIQVLNSYNLLINKMAEKTLEKFTDQMKNARKVGIELYINGNTK